MRRSPRKSSPAADNLELREKSTGNVRPGRLQRLRQQRDQLYEEARDNPDSDAGEMVRALLLSGILSTQPESEEDELVRRSFDEERRQQAIARRRAAEEAGAALLHGRAGASRADSRIREVQARMAEVARVAAEAAARPTMDATAVYSRIAEIIGLQSPAVQAREQQGGEEPGEPKK
jgi:hypothetical protein